MCPIRSAAQRRLVPPSASGMYQMSWTISLRLLGSLRAMAPHADTPAKPERRLSPSRGNTRAASKHGRSDFRLRWVRRRTVEGLALEPGAAAAQVAVPKLLIAQCRQPVRHMNHRVVDGARHLQAKSFWVTRDDEADAAQPALPCTRHTTLAAQTTNR